MKKIVIMLGFVISAILVAIGLFGLVMDKDNTGEKHINSLSELELLKSSLQNIDNITNFTYELNLETDNELENMTSILKVDLTTKQSELLINAAETMMIHSYTVLENGKLIDYVSMPMMGINGYYKKNTDTESSKLNYDKSYIKEILNNINLFENKENNLFIAIIPKSLAQNIIPSTTDGTANDNKQEIIGDIEMAIKLNSDNELEKIVYNFSNSLKVNDKIYTKYIITIKYSDVGSTVIVVPEEIKNNAVEQ